MNHNEDLKRIKRLVGRHCEKSLACNSLKIRFGCDVDERGTSYIWIDPPWIFIKNNNIITHADESPDETIEFKEWANLLNPLNKTQLVSYDYSDKGNFELHFSENYSLLMPYTADEVDENEEVPADDDEHWYIHYD